jgi:CRISPR-associated protein Cmr6
MVPLPRRAAQLIDQVNTGFHSGLALDKHIDPPADAELQKPILQRVCSGLSDQKLLDSLNQRRQQALSTTGPIVWAGKTQGPLTLHLSRATALENAGIALHPLYGFAYLPGSGLKGLARGWTERVWLEAQPDRDAAVREIREVFGYAPNSERGKIWIPPEIVRDPHGSAGGVAFHDAWPVKWPALFIDIVSVHHAEYYREANEQKVPPPGDWEDPVPTTFLAVSPGTEFAFAVAPRRSEHAALARRACEWLTAALADWGAGAKTAAGYGRIVANEAPRQPVVSPQRTRFECTLQLVTPAFLAGAFQKAEDCDLRGATLRGQLRWWWRTMHAGHLDPRLLRRLESAIWGTAGEGSAVQLAIVAQENRAPQTFRERATSPLGYLAYGMQAQPPERRDPRNTKPAGSAWDLVLTARTGQFRRDPKSKDPDSTVSPDAVLRQACAALWLMTRYGGVGAKGRKGFGSLFDVPVDGVTTLDHCTRLGASLRRELGLAAGNPDFRAPCLERMRPSEIKLRQPEPYPALADIATAYRDFIKPRDVGERSPLGLPRAGNRVDMGAPAGRVTRHATTIHFHVARAGDSLLLRTAGFEIARLSRGAGLFQDLEAALRGALGPGSAAPGRLPSGGRPRQGPSRDEPGSRVPAAPTPALLRFRRGERVGNRMGETGIVVSDVRIDDAEMTVDIDGDFETVKVSEWQKI